VALEAIWKASRAYDHAKSKGGRNWTSYAMWKARMGCIDYLREHGPLRRDGRERYPSTNYFRYTPGTDENEPASRHADPDGCRIDPGLLRCLNAVDKEVVRMRFEQGLTQAEIGARIGVCEARISQKLKEIFALLRECLPARVA
jgi:RNA polymerase sigma factor (sigma-70 family)